MSGETLRVDMQVSCVGWKAEWPHLQRESRSLLRRTWAWKDLHRHPSAGEVVIVFADDERLQSLNFQFRGVRKPTNVLSFPDQEVPYGGIALAFETVGREAQQQGKSFINHSKHMILHGFLHLLGYDHIQPGAARLMEGLEIAILSDMNISNPYEGEGHSRA